MNREARKEREGVKSPFFACFATLAVPNSCPTLILESRDCNLLPIDFHGNPTYNESVSGQFMRDSLGKLDFAGG